MRAVLCVDVEPDMRMPDPAVPIEWHGADRLLDDQEWLRDLLGGQVVNWFLRLDHQVEVLHGSLLWPVERFGAGLDRLVRNGDEIGLHPHNWRWTGDRWLPDGSDAWAVDNAARSIESYTEAFGHGPASFRFGDRFVSDDVVRLLIAHPDVKVDLTTEPGVRACRGLVEAEGASGITRHIDVGLARRYRPDGGAVDISSESGNLTMVPLTTAVIPGTATVETLMLWSTPADFDRMLRLRLTDRALDHLAFAIRSEIVLLPWAMEHFEINLATLARCVPDLEWVRASTMALPAEEASDQGLGLIGSLANELDEVIRAVHPDPPIVVPPLADSIRSIGDRCDELSRREIELSEALANAEFLLHRERDRTGELTDALVIERQSAAAVSEQLATIERTLSWRSRRLALPMLRPIARARHRLVGRWLERRPTS